MTKLLAGTAAVVAAAGLVVVAATVQSVPPARARLERKARDLQRLEELAAELGACEAAHAAYAERVAGSRAPELEALWTARGLSADPEGTRAERSPPAEGWARVKRAVTFGAGDIGTVMDFVRAAETSSPPWRLTRCDIRSAAATGGRGTVSLDMETLVPEP